MLPHECRVAFALFEAKLEESVSHEAVHDVYLDLRVSAADAPRLQ